jgi:hypothetical protein
MKRSIAVVWQALSAPTTAPAFLALVLGCASFTSMQSQTLVTGDIAGHVTDSTGAAVVNASVKLISDGPAV